jgi:hypothetical protein
MRARDPRDDPPAKRRPPRYYSGPTVTLGDIRAHGVRRLLIYCSEGLYRCHSATIDADRAQNLRTLAAPTDRVAWWRRGEGFEPPIRLAPYNAPRCACLKPLSHPSENQGASVFLSGPRLLVRKASVVPRQHRRDMITKG